MFTKRTASDLDYIHCIFTRFVKNHPRPICINDFANQIDRGLKRSMQRLLQTWVQWGIIEDLGTSTRQISKYYRLSKYGELFISICKEKSQVNFFDNPQLLNNKINISFRYFFIILYTIENSGKQFTPDDIKSYGDLNGYAITKRSWQRHLNQFVDSGILTSNRVSESSMTLYYQFTIDTNLIFHIPNQNYEIIEFEKNLMSLGLVSNYENYIDYNLLIFHILFRKWIDSPSSFEYFVDNFFYKAS